MWQTRERVIVFGIDAASLVTGERDVARLMRRNSELSASESHEFRGTNGCLQWVTKDLPYPFQFVVKVLPRR